MSSMLCLSAAGTAGSACTSALLACLPVLMRLLRSALAHDAVHGTADCHLGGLPARMLVDQELQKGGIGTDGCGAAG